MGLIEKLTGMTFVILFAVAIIGFITYYAIDNNTGIGASSDLSGLNTELKGNITSFTTDSNDSYSILTGSKIASGDENVEGGGQFKATPGSLTSSFRTIISTGQKIIFGNDTNFAYFATALFSLLIIILGLYIWKAWKGGLPD